MLLLSRSILLLPLAVAVLLGGCAQAQTPAAAESAQPAVSPTAVLGAKLFKDLNLSASGRLSCATCHVPEHAHAGIDGLPAPMGGPLMATMGFRNAPSLRYLDRNTPFFFDHKDGEETPTGGFAWDGRARDFADQANGPLFGPHEMALKDDADIQQRLRAAPYADEFRKVFGDKALDTPGDALKGAGAALMAFQKEDPQFHPYDSKYDYYLAGKAQLTPHEKRGLDLFNDKDKGNCAACHPSTRGPKGEPPIFTDFSFDALGVPRNPQIRATANPEYHDLGICGPDRKDLPQRKDLCGAFKVPTLRNIALTAPYFHNGYFKTLEDAVAFYARRDTNPEEWYPKDKSGKVIKFDDLPPEYLGNVNTREVPYNRKPGEAPALSPQDIQDIVAFLKTLTDGYQTSATP